MACPVEKYIKGTQGDRLTVLTMLYHPVFDTLSTVKEASLLRSSELPLFGLLKNVVWSRYPEIFFSFLFSSFG